MIYICLLIIRNFIVLFHLNQIVIYVLQQDLNNIMDWGKKWLTNFNLHKCKSLSFGIQVNIQNIYSMLSDTEEDHYLDRVEEEGLRCFIQPFLEVR